MGEAELCGSVADVGGLAGAGIGVCAPIGTSPAMHITTLHLFALNLTQTSLQIVRGTHLQIE